MQVNCQPHALPHYPREKTRLPTAQEAEWDARTRKDFWRREKSLPNFPDSKPGLFTPQPSLYTDYTIPYPSDPHGIHIFLCTLDSYSLIKELSWNTIFHHSAQYLDLTPSKLRGLEF